MVCGISRKKKKKMQCTLFTTPPFDYHHQQLMLKEGVYVQGNYSNISSTAKGLPKPKFVSIPLL